MPPSACTNVGACGGSQSQPSKVYFMPSPHEDEILAAIEIVKERDSQRLYQVDSPLYYPPLTADDALDPLFVPSNPIDLLPVEPSRPMEPILQDVHRRLFGLRKSLLPTRVITLPWRKVAVRAAMWIGIVLAFALGLAIMFALGDFLARVIGY